MKPATKRTMDAVAAVLGVILLLGAIVWLFAFIEDWRAEVWSERAREWRPK